MTALLLGIRDAPWLGAPRALAWARLAAAGAALVVLVLLVQTGAGHGPDSAGRPLGADFASFWAAGRLALTGSAAAAYDWAAHGAAQLDRFPPAAGFARDYYAFFYPPPFLLLCLPLALLPYGAAVIGWLLATGTGYVAAVGRLLPAGWPRLLAALSFPAVLLNAEHGQNGALSTALVAAAALQLERRPWLAGMSLGALCFKPHLGLLVAPALLAAGRSRVLGAAAATAGILCLLSLSVFGPAAWLGFLDSLPRARLAMEQGWIGFAKMVSPFAAARLLGGGTALAWAVQAAATILALGMLVTVCRRRPGAHAEGAMLAAAACLGTPFLLDYDLMLLAVPLAWVAGEAARTGWHRWEKPVLAACWLLPLLARSLAMQAGVPVAPLLAGLLMVLVGRRARPAGPHR